MGRCKRPTLGAAVQRSHLAKRIANRKREEIGGGEGGHPSHPDACPALQWPKPRLPPHPFAAEPSTAGGHSYYACAQLRAEDWQRHGWWRQARACTACSPQKNHGGLLVKTNYSSREGLFTAFHPSNAPAYPASACLPDAVVRSPQRLVRFVSSLPSHEQCLFLSVLCRYRRPSIEEPRSVRPHALDYPHRPPRVTQPWATAVRSHGQLHRLQRPGRVRLDARLHGPAALQRHESIARAKWHKVAVRSSSALDDTECLTSNALWPIRCVTSAPNEPTSAARAASALMPRALRGCGRAAAWPAHERAAEARTRARGSTAEPQSRRQSATHWK
jgi:hypothetical protein